VTKCDTLLSRVFQKTSRQSKPSTDLGTGAGAIIRKFSIRKWCGALTPPTFPPIRKSNKKVGAVPLDLSHIVKKLANQKANT
jgi:hypothetical protein